MLRLALKNVRHSPKRLILTGVSVMLGVALVSSTYVLTNAAQLGIGELNEAYYGAGRVVVTPDRDYEGDHPIPLLTDETIVALQALPGVAEVEPRIDASGDAPLLGPDGESFTSAPTVIWNWSDNPEVSRATVVDGRAIEASGEILLDVRSFDRSDWALGDTLSLATFGGIQDYTLVGVVRFGDENILQGAAMVYLSLEDALDLRKGDGGYDRIDLVPDAGVEPTSLIDPATGVLPPGARATTSEFLTEEMDDQVSNAMGIVDAVILVFAFVSVFVGAYIIANTFRIVVAHRTREIGLLRAIAATSSQVRRMVLLEATAIAAAATVAGIGLGWLMAFGLLKWMEDAFGNTYNSVPLPVDSVLLGVGVGFGVTLVSALLPAVHASRIHPLEALRESGTLFRRPLHRRTRAGWVAIGLALALLVSGALRLGGQPIALVGVGALLAILGATLLSPALLQALSSRLRLPLGNWFGVPGTLAVRAIHREPRRAANTASALMIGVFLLSFVATLLGSVRAYANERVAGDVRADLYVSSNQINFATGPVVGPEAYDIVQATPGVGQTMRWGFGTARLDGESYRVGAVDSTVADSMYEFDATPSLETLGDGAFIGPALQSLGYKPGDSMTLDGPLADLTVTVAGVFHGAIGDAVLVDWPTAERLFGSVETTSVLLTIDPGADLEDVRASLDDALSDYPLIRSFTRDDLLGMANSLVSVVLAVASALLAGALVIAILGIANTLTLSITERTREIGLLRAVGLSTRRVRGMIRLESAFLAVGGAVVGIVLGTSIAIAAALSLEDLELPISIPWLLLGVYFVAAVVAGLVAAALPARRASHLDILEAVAAE